MQLLHRRKHFRPWELPADCLLWLSSQRSGAHAAGTYTLPNLSGNVVMTSVGAPVAANEGLVMDGSNYAYSDPITTWDSIMPAFTWCGWIKPTSATGAVQTIIRRTYSSDTFLRIEADGRLRFAGTNVNYVGALSPTSLTSGAWVWFAGTYGPDKKYRLYINGVLVATSTAATVDDNTSPAPIYLGRYPQSAAEFFTGVMDEMMMFPRVLSTDEIAGIYSGSKTVWAS